MAKYDTNLFKPDTTFGERFDPFQIIRGVKERYGGTSARWAKGAMARNDHGKVQLCIMAAVLQAMLERIKGSNVQDGNFSVFGGQSGQEHKAAPVVVEALFDALLTTETGRKVAKESLGYSAASTLDAESLSVEQKVSCLISYNDRQGITFAHIDALLDTAIDLVKCDGDDSCDTTCS